MRICKIDKRRVSVPAEFGLVFDGAKYALMVNDRRRPSFTVYPLKDADGYRALVDQIFSYNFDVDTTDGLLENERRTFLDSQSELVKIPKKNNGLRVVIPQQFLDHAAAKSAVCCVQHTYGMDVWSPEKYESYMAEIQGKLKQ